MAIRTKLAKKLLTKKEQAHLTEGGINSMKSLRSQIEFLKETGCKCFECKHIAAKLGVVTV